ncbi:MAG TPA: phosphatidylglycerol lysyltransferase domain-containing protein [Ktedonobacteraceae bacterium]|nr:phosphatidylglycerol lysyltransferase domain-containing protein [Ktedonobacteraceae bacterium]
MQREIVDTRFLYTDRICRTIRYIAGLVTGLVGLTDMLSAIVPKMSWIVLLGVWPLISHRVQAQTVIVVVGFFLVMLSYGLARGKQHAWRISVFLLLLSAFLHIKRSGSVLSTVVALSLTLALCLLYRFFQARSDPPSVRRGYIVLVLGLGVVSFYAIGGFIALFAQFEPVVERFGVEGFIFRVLTFTHIHFPHGTQALFFERAFPVLCISAILYGMLQLFRPVAATLLPDQEEQRRVTNLLYYYGKNSISYFALDNDKSYFFSSSDKVAISYVLEGSTAVVAGDPIGPIDEIAATIKQFVTFCRTQDWTIVFWQVQAELIELYRVTGFHALKIGEDAIIDTATFSLQGGAMANVRSSAKRAEKDGIRAVFYHGRVSDPEQLCQMEQISRRWLADKGGSEMGFSMGQFDPQADDEICFALAVDPANKVHAFVSFVPIYGRNGWGLDLMRRAEPCAPGTIELLLARSIAHFKSNGAQMVSLGLAPLSNANQEDETFLGTSIDFLTSRFGNPTKNQMLFKFKRKFQPTWESRYLVYSDTLSLPKIGWALYHAHQRDASLLGTLRRSLQERRKLRQQPQQHLTQVQGLNP